MQHIAHHHSSHRPRSNGEMQTAETKGLPLSVVKSVHWQLFELGQGPREVAKRNGLSHDADVVAVALAYERELSAKWGEKCWVEGRRSLLTPRPAQAARRTA